MAAPLTWLLSDLNTVFEEIGSVWYVFGAQAAIIHGASRLTADVDVTVMYGDRPVEDMVKVLKAVGFDIRIADAVAFAARSRVLPVLHVKSGIPVDIVLGGPGLEEIFAGRALEFEIDNVKIPVARGEDVVSMKILAGREKDLEDAISIISVRLEEFDLEQVQDTLVMLEEALDRRDLVPLLNDLIRRAK